MGAFSAFREKRKQKKEIPTVNHHYTKLARISAFVRYTCIILAVIFAVYSLSFHSDEVSMDNFRHMMKYINRGEAAETPALSVIEFDGSSGNRGTIFKGDLAVLNENGLTITDWNGDSYRDSFSCDYPKISENGINLFCYDLCGKELRIYNSFSLLEQISYNYPIYWFSASESGNFAVVTSESGYNRAIMVYDKEFICIYKVKISSEYVDFIDISKSGKEFVTAAHYSENGDFVTLVSKYRTDSETKISEMRFKGELPLGIYYTENGYCLLTSNRLRIFNNSDELTGEVDFSSRDLLSGRVYGNRILLTYRTEGLSGGTEAVIYKTDGSEEYKRSFDGSLSDSIIIGDKLYGLMPGTLTVSDISENETETYNIATSFSSIISDGTKPILFSENRAEYFDGNTTEQTDE